MRLNPHFHGEPEGNQNTRNNHTPGELPGHEQQNTAEKTWPTKSPRSCGQAHTRTCCDQHSKEKHTFAVGAE